MPDEGAMHTIKEHDRTLTASNPADCSPKMQSSSFALKDPETLKVTMFPPYTGPWLGQIDDTMKLAASFGAAITSVYTY